MKSQMLPPVAPNQPLRSLPVSRLAGAFFLNFFFCLAAVLALPAQEPGKAKDAIQITRITPKSGKIRKDGRLLVDVSYKNSRTTRVWLSAVLLSGGKSLVQSTYRPLPAAKGMATATLEVWVTQPMVSDEITVYLMDLDAKERVVTQTKPLKLTWEGPSPNSPDARKP